MTVLRSRQPRSENEANHDDAAKNNDGADGREKDKGNAKSSFERNKAQIRIILVTLLCCIVVVVKTKIIHARDAPPSPLSSDAYGDNAGKNDGNTARRRNPAANPVPMGAIIYGAKSKGDDTAKLVKDAIQAGFRHIATVRPIMLPLKLTPTLSHTHKTANGICFRINFGGGCIQCKDTVVLCIIQYYSPLLVTQRTNLSTVASLTELSRYQLAQLSSFVIY